jgi:high-affinity iron transporter
MTTVTLFLSIGLFTGGAHEFEEVFGETRKVWAAQNPFWSSSSFPMVILKPFGYSSSRTVLQIVCFWLWTAFGAVLHFLKYHNTQKYRAQAAVVAKPEYKASETNLNTDEETGNGNTQSDKESSIRIAQSED